MKTTTIWDGLC